MALYDYQGNTLNVGGTSVIYGGRRPIFSPNTYDMTIKNVNHRGYSNVAPENTLPAYQYSKKNGFFFVETDVKHTSDGVAVLCHNYYINSVARNADGSELSENVAVSESTYEELLAYDFGIFMGDEFAGTKIATFDEFIALCKKLGLHPYIEMKDGTSAQIQKLYETVRSYDMTEKVTWIGAATYLGYIKNQDATARLGIVANSCDTATIASAKNLQTSENEVFIDLYNNAVTDDVVMMCKAAEIPLEVFTFVDSEDEIKSLHPYVSGFTADQLMAGKVLYDANIG